MLTIPPSVASVLVAGLDDEILRQEAIGAQPDQDWPDDYDPNDAAIYRSFRTLLLEKEGRPVNLHGSLTCKPISFVLTLLPGFVRARLHVLSPAEVDAACRVFAQYVAYECVEFMDERPASSMRARIIQHLAELRAFPGTGGEVGGA